MCFWSGWSHAFQDWHKCIVLWKLIAQIHFSYYNFLDMKFVICMRYMITKHRQSCWRLVVPILSNLHCKKNCSVKQLLVEYLPTGITCHNEKVDAKLILSSVQTQHCHIQGHSTQSAIAVRGHVGCSEACQTTNFPKKETICKLIRQCKGRDSARKALWVGCKITKHNTDVRLLQSSASYSKQASSVL